MQGKITVEISFTNRNESRRRDNRKAPEGDRDRLLQSPGLVCFGGYHG